MDAILHKLCEKSQQELWDLLKEPEWTKDHAEVAFYMVEILKGTKKIAHIEKLDKAMDEYDKEEEIKKMMEKEKGGDEEEEKSQFARGGSRGGRGSGSRGSGGRGGNNYGYYGLDEEEEEGMEDYARRGGRRGGGRRRNYAYAYEYGYPAPHMPNPDWGDMQQPPMIYAFATGSGSGGGGNSGGSSGGSSGGNSGGGNSGGNFNTTGGNNFNAAAAYYENKYRELLEDKWEKEKKEKEKEKEPLMARMSPSSTNK